MSTTTIGQYTQTPSEMQEISLRALDIMNGSIDSVGQSQTTTQPLKTAQRQHKQSRVNKRPMSNRTSQRPDSRASTTSAVSQHHDAHPLAGTLDSTSAPAGYLPASQALMHYQTAAAAQQPPQYDAALSQQLLANGHAQRAGFPVQAVYTAHDSPFMQQGMVFGEHVRMGSVPIQPAPDVLEDKRRKGSAVTATNDKELREMLSRNEGRPLREVAQEVIAKERTPMAEKTKQLFAMLWLRTVCKPAKTSVPRNRVYSQYATRCGTERVVPLNPASFGKLVRVIFPGIQTRRLGVRGESKYHYVDLALEEEHPLAGMSSAWPNAVLAPHSRHRSQSASTQQIDFNSIPRLSADTAAFPTADGSPDLQQSSQAVARGLTSRSQTFVYPDTRGMQPGTLESLSYHRTLCFPPSSTPVFSENEPVHLPPITQYLPPRTDPDTAEALSALYRTHCTSLIDSIRFCKEKQFFRLYASFHGTLTVPVQKLFTHANLAPWIEQCDLVMYRTMVRFVSRLTLQAAPVLVINVLSNISASLHNHISKTFAAQPAHVREAKLRPATVFAGLLYRLIRVNQSAHAAANLLTIDQNREQMWHEWVTMVNPKRVMEAELPDCGYEETYKILTTEVRSLLEPLQAPPLHDDLSNPAFYSFDTDAGNFASFLQEQTAPPSRSGPSQVSTENVLDRWSSFLSSLPARFPRAPARTLLHCISAVGTAALRDITIMSGQSYGHWWVLKIFVDEMALWLAEMGGFLEPTIVSPPAASGNAFPSPVMENGNNGRSQSGSRMSSLGPGGSLGGRHDDPSHPLFPSESQTQNFSQHSYSAPPQMNGLANAPPRQPSSLKPHQQHHETDLDDSGIGMSLIDDGLKFGIDTSHLGMEEMV